MYLGIMTINMLYMFINFLNYIMLIIVMVMSRSSVSFIVCMFYFPGKVIIIITNNKFIYLVTLILSLMYMALCLLTTASSIKCNVFF